jgi:Domain of unknown function (DUF4411)
LSDPPKYLLDANVFIQAARDYYAFDLAPAFWQALVDHASSGRLLSIDRVKDEIEQGKDELADWVASAFSTWFASTNEADVLGAYAVVMRWAQAETQYSDAAKAEFADTKNADAWLIAYARAKGGVIVVTLEQPNPNVRRRIPIPNVCKGLGISYLDSFAMLRALGVRLG